MAKIRNRKNCSYRIDGISLTPEYGELEVDDKRAEELCQLDGIEIVKYDEIEVPVLATSEPVHDVEIPVVVDPIPDEDTKVETPKKKRGRKAKRK